MVVGWYVFEECIQLVWCVVGIVVDLVGCFDCYVQIVLFVSVLFDCIVCSRYLIQIFLGNCGNGVFS